MWIESGLHTMLRAILILIQISTIHVNAVITRIGLNRFAKCKQGLCDTTLHVLCHNTFRRNQDNLKKISQGIIPDRWKLFFKMFCFISPHNVPADSIEAAFMYEQVSPNNFTILSSNPLNLSYICSPNLSEEFLK